MFTQTPSLVGNASNEKAYKLIVQMLDFTYLAHFLLFSPKHVQTPFILFGHLPRWKQCKDGCVSVVFPFSDFSFQNTGTLYLGSKIETEVKCPEEHHG